MNGHCADCHEPFNDESVLKVIRLVHRTCARASDPEIVALFQELAERTEECERLRPYLRYVYEQRILCRACDEREVQDPQDLCPECAVISGEFHYGRGTD